MYTHRFDLPRDSAASRIRCDLPPLLRRLWPAIVLLAPALLLRNSVTPAWLAVLQGLSCAILTATFFLRRRIPPAASVLVITICLYACGSGAIATVDPFTAIALGIALLFASSAFVILVETETMFTHASLPMESTTSGGRQIIAGECQAPMQADCTPINRNLETVAYALSHDLRAPLRAIEGFARALTDDFGEHLPPAAARDLREIQAGVARMQRMVARWLSFMRGNDAVARERVNLSDLADSLLMELQAAEPHRVVSVQIEPQLIVEGDPVLLRELLQNLLGNAWKFTRTRQPAVIEVGSLRSGAQSVYFVRDNGIGFASEDESRLFEPFSKLHAPMDYEGSGIGLTIARNIVAAHGGHIWADGQCNGAVFSFTLEPHKYEFVRPIDPSRSLFDFRRTQ